MADRLLEMTTAIVGSYLENNRATAEEVAGIIRSVHASLKATEQPAEEQGPETPQLTKAQIKKSVRPDAIISFEDGKPYRTMKRHLSGLGMTPAEYRAKWGLPADYPMVAPDYSAKRSELAKRLGLGQKRQPAPKTTAKRSKAKAADKS